ncbi:MBOAT, membrane-bound O-acyltransferase family-domain-containing protein [Lipomyces kononenkoae]|uniref:MBOAT, membrane-bound O-acyltransferase family-domain-containing protein n=1 Tax=Lipomyces kononenkoae TaxID=34357 RepID=A0ACC3TB05_LIPKO
MIKFIDSFMGVVAKSIGLPTDPLKLFLTFLLSYPFCAVLKRLPDSQPIYKQLFCLSVSLFYLLGVFSLWDGLRTLLISTLGTYAIAKYVKSPLMPWIVFVFVMGHLTVKHVERYFNPLWDSEVDITGAQMVLVMKLSAFGWNVHDGRRPPAELSPIQKDRALTTLPPIVDYLTYVFYFPSLLIGPSFDYAEFRRWLDFSMFDSESTAQQPMNGKGRKVRKRKIPRSGRVAARKALEGVFWIGLWVGLGTIFSSKYILSDEFRGRSFLFRVLYLWPLGFSYRVKYYGAWSLTEGACILSGLGYNGIDPATNKRKWDRVKNIDAYRFETGQNTYTLLETWNMNTNKWLKTYVYLRVTPKGKKPGFNSTLITFLTSAFWHGVSPGYYLTFVTGAFMQSSGRAARRYIRPLFLTPDLSQAGPYKAYYDVLTYVGTQLTMAYAVQPFVLLTFSDSMKAWRAVYFYIHIILFTMTAIFSTKSVTKKIELMLAARTKTASKLEQLRFEIEKARAKRAPSELVGREVEEVHEPSLGIPDNSIEESVEAIQMDLAELKSDLEQFKRRTMKAPGEGDARPRISKREV